MRDLLPKSIAVGVVATLLSLGLSACGLGGGPSQADVVAVRDALEKVPGVDVYYVNGDSPQSSALARGLTISVVGVNGTFSATDLRRVLQALQSVLPDDYRHRIQVNVNVYGPDGEREIFLIEDLIEDLGLSRYLRGGPGRMTFTMADIAQLRE